MPIVADGGTDWPPWPGLMTVVEVGTLIVWPKKVGEHTAVALVEAGLMGGPPAPPLAAGSVC